MEVLEEFRFVFESERSELEVLCVEVMIMGEGFDGKDVKVLENGWFEVEIECFNGFLEGVWLGKWEVIR